LDTRLGNRLVAREALASLSALLLALLRAVVDHAALQ